MTKPSRSFRIDPELLKKAKELNLDLTSVIEKSLSAAVKLRKCPTCGQKLKPPKNH